MPAISLHSIGLRSALVASIGAMTLAGVQAPGSAARATTSPRTLMGMPMGVIEP